MNNKNLVRLAFAGIILASAAALLRHRSSVLGLLPRSWKDTIKAGSLYRVCSAALNRHQIRRLAASGKLFCLPPTPAEAAQILSEWRQAERPLPGPGAFKQSVLRFYGKEFGLTTLIETGTYTGDTLAALKNDFRRINSIELNSELVRRVRKRFQNDAHITILHGDSEQRLPEILAQIKEPALFWLDGHYSGGVTSLGSKVTPILGELEAVLAHPVEGHVVLIDDARDFQHDKGHPTLDELRTFIAARRPELLFEVEDDIIRLLPG